MEPPPRRGAVYRQNSVDVLARKYAKQTTAAKKTTAKAKKAAATKTTATLESAPATKTKELKVGKEKGEAKLAAEAEDEEVLDLAKSKKRQRKAEGIEAKPAKKSRKHA